MTDERPAYRRVVIKLSGEGLSGPGGSVDADVVGAIAADLRSVIALGTQVGIVVGGGNFLRGTQLPGVNRSVGDQMGMLATAMNGLALQDSLDRLGLDTRVLSAVPIAGFCEPFVRRRALRHLDKGRVVIFVGGTGNPFFTTDTAAALRANEVEADALLKATQVDGVYSADPKKDPTAQRYDSLDFQEVIRKDLKVMDTAAVVLCKENRIPIVVFDLHQPGNLVKACRGENIGTVVGERPVSS